VANSLHFYSDPSKSLIFYQSISLDENKMIREAHIENPCREADRADVTIAGSTAKIARSFYEQQTVDVAKQLLGKYLVRKHQEGSTVGRIVETEAYIGPHDLACHAAKGRTARTEVMFGSAGHAYVYFVYGVHYMLNLVTEATNYPAAVLIRALEPVEGIELMQARRMTENRRNLCSGPGKLCQAFAIDRSVNAADLCGDIVYIEDRGEPRPIFFAKPRIGVDYAGKWKDKPFRFLVRGNEFISRS
jgi:DNA-3-methyladenine glycosylase